MLLVISKQTKCQNKPSTILRHIVNKFASPSYNNLLDKGVHTDIQVFSLLSVYIEYGQCNEQ